MRNHKLLIFIIILSIVGFLVFRSGGYPPMTGTVVDAVTGQPIEGAVVLVEWTRTHGIGEHWTESFKVEDAVTGKNGKFTVAGLDVRDVDRPDVTVYKNGYVAWSSRWIFPSYENRTDFRWGDIVFKLEHFRAEYSHDAHTSFIDSSINASLKNNYEFKETIFRAIEWEQTLAFQERLRNKKQ